MENGVLDVPSTALQPLAGGDANLSRSSHEHDPPQAQDHYVEYLARVNETIEVQATEDICNSRGLLLVKSGARIDRAVADHILQHKLLKPLEELVELQNQINGDKLNLLFDRLSSRFDDIAQIHRRLGFGELFKSLLYFPGICNCLNQKLTVFQEQMPERFEGGLFGGWLAALLARELGWDQEGIRAAFFAGLTRDLGFLHLDPAVVSKKEPLNATEWRTIMGHVVVANLLLSNVSCVPRSVVRAVLEHHERCDGTGYPAGRSGDQLSQLGNIIGLVDTLQAQRMQRFERRGRNLMDARPYLQLHAGKHSEPVIQAMIQILKRSGLVMTCSQGQELAVVAARLQDRLVCLQQMIPVLAQLVAIIDELDDLGKGGHSIGLMAANLLNTVKRSGLDQDELVDWARCVENAPEDRHMAEINEMELLADELMWEFNSLHRACRDLYTGHRDNQPTWDVIRRLCETLDQRLSRRPGHA